MASGPSGGLARSVFVKDNETEDADEILDALRSSGRYQAGGGATPEFKITSTGAA